MGTGVTNNNNNNLGTIYFPSGKPVPELLTAEETIHLLRLDEDGPEHPEMTLQYYRQQGLLRPTKIGKKLRYRLSELLKFLEEQTNRTNEDIS